MAERQICVAVKADGQRCQLRSTDGQRCRRHVTLVNRLGPNTTAQREMDYTHKRAMRELTAGWDQRIEDEPDANRRRDLMLDSVHEKNALQVQQRRELELLRRAQRQEIERTGVDPDAEARRRFEERERQRIQMMRQRFEEVRGDEEAEHEAIRAQAIDLMRDMLDRDRQEREGAANRELARFANDNQNVHTTQSVNMTKDMVQLILTIPVPEEYKWNMNECSKTPGDIIMTCKLTPKAAWQMSAKYCQDESIYEMGKGIYGKVLDGVWQYILSSQDKTDLCNCLKQEMEDNIGMCAQGNLSRLCNILAGYMEGIKSQESISEILGRLMPKLMEIEDLPKRLQEAYGILKTNKVPESQWESWLSPIVSDQDDELVVRFLKDDADKIIGLVAVGL
jgi:hypothetical protein